MSLRIDSTFDLRGYIESEIGGRSENQDSAGALDTDIGTVVVVCDGMGGMKGGKTASMLAVQTIIDDVALAKPDDSPETVLKDAVKHAHEVILEAGRNDPELSGMGTTVTAVIISKECATVAHVGDSRIYQLRGKKKVFRTTDHSFVFELVKAGTLTEDQARLSAQSNIILKALGVDCDVTPDVSVLPYLKGDRFVLCTDGYWGACSEEEFIGMLTKKGFIKDVLWDTTKEINRIGIENGGGHDNFTAAVFDVLRESRIKPAMSKRLKIIFSAVVLLLIGSLYVNFRSIGMINDDKEKLKLASDFAVEVSQLDTIGASAEQKEFLKAFASAPGDNEEAEPQKKD